VKHRIELNLPALEPATAAWLLDLCGQLQHAILQGYGDELEVYWMATTPEQPIAGPLHPPPRRRSRRSRA
jgi:hypothetical protein